MIPAGGLSLSASSSASGEATGGNQGGAAFGDFNFKSASGASSSGGGIPPMLIVAGLALVGLFLWSKK